MKKDIEQIKNILKKELPKLQAQYNIEALELFGSLVRGEQSSHSDIDILVTFKKAPSLFKFLELEEYLSNLLGNKVDLVMKKTLKPNIGKRILSEAQPLT